MASVMSAGGSIRCSSIRLTFTPHLSVAVSMTLRKLQVDLVARRQTGVEIHLADHVTKVGLRQLGGGDE